MRYDRFGRAEVAHHADFDLDSFTLEVCVRFHAVPTSIGEEWVLLSKGGEDSDVNYALSVFVDANGLIHQRGIFADTTTGAIKEVTSEAYLVNGLAPRVGQWLWLSFIYDNSAELAYLSAYDREATPLATANVAYRPAFGQSMAGDGPEHNSHPIRIACGTDASGNPELYSQVSLHEIRLWNVVRTNVESTAVLNRRLVGDETGLVGYWRSDEGTGRTLYDRSRGNGRNATVYGGATWTDAPSDLYHPPSGVLTPGVGYLGYYSATQAATITASDEDADYPAERLRNPWQVKTTRTANDTGTKTWVFAFDKRYPISAFTLRNHNLDSTAEVLIELNDADSWGSPSISVLLPFHPGKIHHIFDVVREFAFARLSITDASNPDGYLEFGLADWWVGEYLWDPPPMTGVQVPVADTSSVVETPFREQTTRDVGAREDLTVMLDRSRRGVAYELERLVRTYGPGGYVWVVPDPMRTLYTIEAYGRLSALGGMKYNGATGAYRTLEAVTVESDRP